jgi:hypothetical protein
MNAQGTPRPLTEKQKRLRQRNWALLAALAAFVVLVYVVTIVKLKGG